MFNFSDFYFSFISLFLYLFLVFLSLKGGAMEESSVSGKAQNLLPFVIIN